jgi:hypothetical protein
MLQSIIDYLTIKLQALKIADVYGLGELVVDKDSEKPALYTGSGQYQSLVNFDNHNGLMYFRLVSPVSNAIAESQVGGEDVFQRTYNLRIIAYVNKDVYNTDNNYIDDKIAHNIQLAIDNEDDGLLSTSLGAQTATIQTISYETNRRNVSDGESLGFDIPFNYVFLALDFNVIIIGSQDCFSTYGCNDTPIDYLELLRAEICESECLDGSATATNSLSTVLGSVSVPSGGTANIPITDSTITRSDATTIATVPAETNATIADSPVTLQNTATTTLSTTNVLADKATTITAPDATANAKNSLNNTVGTANVPSGATGNVTVGDSSILRSDLTTIATTPATVSYTVADSPVRVEYVNGSLISNTNVKAASSATIQVPNPTVCPTLDDLVDSSTVSDVVTAINNADKECGVISGLLDVYPTAVFTGGNFAPIGVNSLSVYVNANIIYVLNVTKIDLYNATTFAFIGSVLGFTRATEIAFSTTTYAVCDFNANNVRIIDIATNIEVTNFSVVTNPFSICFSDDFTKLYVAAFSAAGSVSIYNTSGVLQGTVTGFDTNIIEMRSVGTEYWVLTATGTTGGNTQRVRKMRFSDNTQVSTNSLGTVVSIGAIRAMVVVDSNVYIATSLGTQNAYTLICYDLSFGSPITFTLGLTAANAYGLTYNPNICNNLIMLNPNAGFCYNIIV